MVKAGAVGGTLALSGCMEQLQNLAGNGGKLSMGESTEHNGIEITVHEYMTASEMKTGVPMGNQEVDRSAPNGAIFILTKITAEHVGENERKFPTRGLSSYGEFALYYNDEEMDNLGRVVSPPYFKIDGERYRGYAYQISENTNDLPVYEGNFTGWIAHEIPDGFDPDETELSIEWGGEIATWVYASE